MKSILLSAVCILALTACQSAGKKASAPPPPSKDKIEITGSASTSMASEPIIPNDPNVRVYDTAGPVINPLMTNGTHSVLDNTTAGGYTVFDESVTVYPLPGEDVPAYMPTYAVPPLEKQYKPQTPKVGTPMGLASAGLLPPVPNVDVKDADPFAKPPVSGAVREPLVLNAQKPLTMQPPVPRAPMLSPFDEPVTQQAAPIEAAPQPPAQAMTAGRRSGPMLTGY